MDNIGKYQLLKQLGIGTTSQVYLAVDPFSNQQVAIKIFEQNHDHDPKSAKAYKKLMHVEASLVGRLNHPHIVKLIDAVLNDTQSYIVMEYVDGGTLEHFSDPEWLLPFNRVAELMYKCCKALEYAQSQGVIHRDIKPANILLQGESDIKISDFGAAIIEDHETTQVSGVGSPSYMSPEQIMEQTLTHQTDIYSLGVTMYKLLSGKLPFQANSGSIMTYQIVNAEPIPLKTYRRDIPNVLDIIVQRAMQKDLRQRYQTWAAFANDLAMFFNLDEASRTEIYDTEKFSTLRTTSFFERFSDIELWEVLRFSKWHKVSAGETILEEGNTGDAFFILTQGIVKILKGNRVVSFLHKGDCFGEIKRLPGSAYRRTTGVVAGTDCILFEVTLNALENASMACRFQFGEAFLTVLLKRLDLADTRISKLLAPQKDGATSV